jgi:hypothetical protein
MKVERKALSLAIIQLLQACRAISQTHKACPEDLNFAAKCGKDQQEKEACR